MANTERPSEINEFSGFNRILKSRFVQALLNKLLSLIHI